MNYKAFLAALFLLHEVILTAYAGDLLQIGDNSKFYNPAVFSSYFIDPEDRLSIHDILNSKNNIKFIPQSNDIPNFGLISDAVWLRFDIKNMLNDSPWLEINNPDLDKVEYMLFNKSGDLVHHHIARNSDRISSRTLMSGRYMFDMHLNTGEEYTVYLKTKASTSILMLPMRIASLQAFYQSGHVEWIWSGVYFGFILFLVVYNLFLTFSLKDRTYFYFAVFIAFIGLLFVIFKGVNLELLGIDFEKLNQFTVVLASLSGVSLILFSSLFLQSSKKYPVLHKWLLGLTGLFFIIIGIDIAGYRFIAIKLMVYNSLTGMGFMILLAAKAWKDGYKPAKYYLLAWSFYLTGMLIHLARESALININIFVANILQISSTISIILMSFALSKKINIYINKRNEAQEMALRTALENERLISDQNQLLEARVHERTIDLEQSIVTLRKQREELKEINLFKDKVFSIISHDLKSPITTLAGLLQVMKMKNLDEEERSKAIKSLEIALKSTKTLLDNILNWANKNKKHGEEQEFEIHAVVKEILLLFQLQTETKNITVKNLIEPSFHIITSKDMLELVLRNLISNAIKFTPRDGTIEIGMRQDYLNLYLYVKDSGVGMSEETIVKLFKENKHISTRGTENEKGTGLGLLLCKEFLKKYNGSLQVESKIGQGSTFTIKLKNAIPVLEVVMN